MDSMETDEPTHGVQTCAVCKWTWTTRRGKSTPKRCPNPDCRSTRWRGAADRPPNDEIQPPAPTVEAVESDTERAETPGVADAKPEPPQPPEITWRKVFHDFESYGPEKRVAEFRKLADGRVLHPSFFKLETEDKIKWLEEHWPL